MTTKVGSGITIVILLSAQFRLSLCRMSIKNIEQRNVSYNTEIIEYPLFLFAVRIHLEI